MNVSELYQSVILDHNSKPRNFREMESFTHRIEGYNPLCGDHFTVFLKLDGDLVADISFVGTGCAISKASTSLMTAAVKGKTRPEALEIFERFHHLITADLDEELDLESVGKLAVFSGVREFPARVKCATLSWHTLRTGLTEDESNSPVTTE